MSDVNMNAGMGQRMVAGAAMKLGVDVLQANSMELGQIVRQALEQNPVLEQESSPELLGLDDAEMEPSDFPEKNDDWELNLHNPSANDALSSKRDFFFNSITEEQTLAAFLHEQVHLSDYPEKLRRALDILIDSLDSRGFFEDAPEDIAASNKIDRNTLKKALKELRAMEPSGVGAANLRESLLIQLENASEQSSWAYRLVSECWDELVQRKYAQIIQKTSISDEELSEAVGRIGRLNPDPGVQFSVARNPHIYPDVVVEKEPDGTFEVSLTSDFIPKLKLSDYYKDALSENYDNAELRTYLKNAFSKGRELIQAIAQRQETILKISRLIIESQKEYFDKGPHYLKPMNMASIAEMADIHVSTVSRAVAGKYLICKWGLKELRSFFSSGISTVETSDQDVSSASVRELIKEIVSKEDKRSPHSDAAITKELQSRGVDIARRTVAKYREQLRILPASHRKTLA